MSAACRDRVGAEHGRTLQAAIEDTITIEPSCARSSAARHRNQPVVGDDVIVENFAELVVEMPPSGP